MANSNGRITAPIRVTDVKTVLGVNNNNVGYLCSNKHGRINKWAKYKPTIYPAVVVDQQRQYKAFDRFCGFKAMTSSDIITQYKNDTGWVYNPPTGGSSSPFRMGDFRNYYHLAEPFARSNISKGTILNIHTQETPTWTFNLYNKLADPNSIVLKDLEDSTLTLTNVRFCAHVYTQNPITSTSNLGLGSMFVSEEIINKDGWVPVQIDVSRFQGNHLWILFSMKAQTSTDIYLPLPYDDSNYYMVECELYKSGSSIFGFAWTEIGFYYNTTAFTPLQPVNNFLPPGSNKPFRVDARGQLRVIISITNKDRVNTKIYYDRTSFSMINRNSGNSLHGYIDKLNGRTVYEGDFPYTFSPGQVINAEVVFDGEPFSPNDVGNVVNVQVSSIRYGVVNTFPLYITMN